MNNKGFISVGVVLVAVLLIIVGGFVSLYNGLKEAEITVDASYGQVENQMQRRSDLIPNLVNTVKGYDIHEKSIIEEVVNARAKLAGAQSVEQMDAANAELTGALGRLFAIVEAYPDLKANTQYLELMRELSGSENRIAVARRDYNEAVRAYNVRIATFPGVFLAGMMA
ncbi:MAG: LemA family protein [Negativicutes bacterium]